VFKEGKDKMKIKNREIRRRKRAISYCPGFLEYGIYCVLQDRIYLPGQPILYDHVLWKQCHNCVITVALFARNMKQRWSLKNAVEPSNNPFDEGRIYYWFR
jgi:hypothetical protein